METNRRDLLKSAATAAAVVSTVPVSAAAEALAAPVIEVSTPAKLSPYANYVWEWFVSHDGSVYYESFPAKEEAIQYAQDCEYSIVAECKQQDFDLSVDGWWLIEHINDNNMELVGEGEGIEATDEQQADLEAMVRMATEAWAVKHQINLTAWTFAASRNETVVAEKTAPQS